MLTNAWRTFISGRLRSFACAPAFAVNPDRWWRAGIRHATYGIVRPVSVGPTKAHAMSVKSVAIAADHAGFELKSALKEDLAAMGYSILDLGTGGPESVDYPDFAG